MKSRGRAFEYACLLGGSAATGTVLGFCGRLGWLLDLFAHFRAQYVVLLGIAIALAAFAKSRRLIAGFAAALILNAAVVAPLWIGRGVEPAAARLRLGYVNVLTSNKNESAVMGWIESSGADVMLVVEVDDRWHRRLVSSSAYDVAFSDPESDNFGMALLTRRGGHATLTSAGHASVFDATDVPVLESRVEFAGCGLRFLGLHTLPPTGARYAARRDGQLATAVSWARGDDPVVILGDLNATPWSYPLRRLIRRGRLVDSARGFGLHPTWPAFPGPISALRVPIDQCLHSASLVTTRRELGPFVGSDHFPLLVELAWQADRPCDVLPATKDPR